MNTVASDPPDPESKLTAALFYARLGLRVFPVHSVRKDGRETYRCDCGKANCDRPGKHPHFNRTTLQHGAANATTDEETITRWWKLWPRANIGIATGRASGVLVLDVDHGDEGLAELEGYTLKQGVSFTHDSGLAKTGNGHQFYFKHPNDGREFKQRIAGDKRWPFKHVDFKGDSNNYVIAPPSDHANGNKYVWVTTLPTALDELPDLPAWLIEAHTPRGDASDASDASDTTEALPAGEQTEQTETADDAEGESGLSAAYYLEKAYDRVLDEGAFRNQTGFWLACQLRDNHVDKSTAKMVLRTYQMTVANEGAQGEAYTWEEAEKSLDQAYGAKARESAPVGAKSTRRGGRGATGGWSEITGHEEQRGEYNLTERGNAQRLMDRYRGQFGYSTALDWCAWNQKRGRWVVGEDAELLVRQWADFVVSDLLGEAGELLSQAARAKTQNRDADGRKLTAEGEALFGWAMKSQKAAMIPAMVNLAKPQTTIDHRRFDTKPMLLNCKNGTVDLTTGELRPHRLEDYLTQQCPVEYDPSIDAPIFERFVDEITLAAVDPSRTELRDYLHRLFGYTISGSTKEQVWHLLIGSGENGKTTLVEAIRFVLGEYAGILEPDALTLKRNDFKNDEAPSPTIAHLRGKRFVSVSETQEGARIDPQRVKRFSGEDALHARQMYARTPFEFVPVLKLFIYTNHRPQTRETSHGFWRRVRLVPFDFVPEKRDKNLPTKLRDEAQGILTWLVQGCLAWQMQGLNPPQIVQVATEAYAKDSDVIEAFIAERCRIAPSYRTAMSVLYDEYKDWCDDSGERAVSLRRLSDRLTDLGYPNVHTMKGNAREGLKVTRQFNMKMGEL